VKKLREKYPSVRIIFPTANDKEAQITLLGKKDEVGSLIFPFYRSNLIPLALGRSRKEAI